MTKRDHTNAERQRRYIARLKARAVAAESGVSDTPSGDGVSNTTGEWLIEITEDDGSRHTKTLEQFLRDSSYSEWLQRALVKKLENEVKELNDEADELVAKYNELLDDYNELPRDAEQELFGAMAMSLA